GEVLRGALLVSAPLPRAPPSLVGVRAARIEGEGPRVVGDRGREVALLLLRVAAPRVRLRVGGRELDGPVVVAQRRLVLPHPVPGVPPRDEGVGVARIELDRLREVRDRLPVAALLDLR